MALRTLLIFVVVTTASAGGCSQSDQDTIEAHYHTGDISFGEKGNACTHSNWGVFSGLNKDGLTQCYMDKTSISNSCAQCFTNHGQYAISNCKARCFWSWCSASCLSCLHQDLGNLNSCAGFSYPILTSCNSPVVPGPPLDAENLSSFAEAPLGLSSALLIGFFTGSIVTFAVHFIRRRAANVAEEPLLTGTSGD